MFPICRDKPTLRQATVAKMKWARDSIPFS